jgi:hypothetical protein
MAKRQIIPKWRPALELLASSADGCTEELLFAHGFTDATIAGLVDAGLVAVTTQRDLANQSPVDVTRFMITDRGRAVLETVPVPAVPDASSQMIAHRRRD